MHSGIPPYLLKLQKFFASFFKKKKTFPSFLGDLMNVDLALARQFGLSEEEYGKVLAIQGRAPTLTELGIFSVMWS